MVVFTGSKISSAVITEILLVYTVILMKLQSAKIAPSQTKNKKAISQRLKFNHMKVTTISQLKKCSSKRVRTKSASITSLMSK
jgi:hypothetical protein